MHKRNLEPFKRCRVIYRDPDNNYRSKSIVCKDNTTPKKAALGKAKCVSLTAQSDGTLHIIGWSLIDRVIFESADRVYGTFHEVGEIPLKEL